MQFLTILSLAVLIPASIAVYTQNPIYSVLGLILVFFGISILLFLIEADFLAMIFLVVYIGAIAVLFLFVVMMLDLRSDPEQDRLLISLGYIVVGISLFGILEYLVNIKRVSYFSLTGFTAPYLSLTDINWVNRLSNNLNLINLGELLYTYYAIPFIISGFILLLAMVGSIVLTLYHTQIVKRQDLFLQLDRSDTIKLLIDLCSLIG